MNDTQAKKITGEFSRLPILQSSRSTPVPVGRVSSCLFLKQKKGETAGGFTLVETLVAIAILMVAVAAPMTLASRGLTASIYSRDQVTAFYLAEEAVEYVRNVRDSNNLSNGSTSWLSGLDYCIVTIASPNQTCGIDVTANQPIFDCTGTNVLNCNVIFDPTIGHQTSGLYGSPSRSGSAGWVPTIFTRSIQIFQLGTGNGASDEANVQVTIAWNEGSIKRSFVANEHLFNWLRSK